MSGAVVIAHSKPPHVTNEHRRMKYQNIREEELKNKVGADWFKSFDSTEILGNIDFTVFPKQNNIFGRIPLLWAEAKTGDYDVSTMFVQLILTIGKARTFDKTLPPAFLGAFDFKKIAFVPYSSVQDIFYLNDFNWNVTPSNHETKEFKLIKERVEATLKQNTYVYDYQKDETELKHFIANNIAKATEISKIKIDKNNFVPIYLRWLDIIKPIIDVNWDDVKKVNLLDSDFYLADLFVDDKDTQRIDDDTSIRENLFVFFQRQEYIIPREYLNTMFDASISIKNKETYQNFWKRYKRPPLSEFHDYIIERRDLLVPQDIRERKGAFFTPRQWVELSQKYLTDYLGENWQDEYYIWDCAAGTGNLLAGLTNKYNIFASTLDQADVNVMYERIEHGANLLKSQVFQFDFLNDDFTKLPKNLQNIINDPEKRKKLVVYINPPYAEATATDTINNKNIRHKAGVSQNKIYDKYSKILGRGINEVFIQFLIRIYKEIPECKIAQFSTLKILLGQNISLFRDIFKPKLEKLFLVAGNTFDNVKGQFPIGFFIWNSEKLEKFNSIQADVYSKDNNTINFIGNKTITVTENKKVILNWMQQYYDNKNERIAYMVRGASDFQNNQIVFITLSPSKAVVDHSQTHNITKNNLIQNCIYFAVRKVIPATWLNDRDQFLYPNDGWKTDKEFQNDCLAYTLFNNNIQSQYGVNHWIPFTEYEVNAQEMFESNFMYKFIKGKIKPEEKPDIYTSVSEPTTHYETPLRFSAEAKAVFDAGRELWKYYNSFKAISYNASLYDIRAFFQGRNNKGRMNAKSTDAKYTALIADLRQKLTILADKIAPKVYEYGFLKE